MASNALVYNIIARDRTSSGLMKAAANVQKAAFKAAGSTALLTAKVSAAAVAATTLAGAVTPAAGALLLLPAAGMGAAVGIGGLVVAFKGLGDAMDATDPESKAEALKTLSPAGQEVAKSIWAVTPAWKAMQKAVQNSTLKGVGKDLRLTSNAVLPTLRKRLVETGAAWNVGFRESLKLVRSKGFVKDLDTAMGNANKATGFLARAIAPVVSGLRHIGVVGSKFLPGLGKAVLANAKSFERWAANARKTGELETRIRGAIGVVKQLGQIGAGVAGTLRAVFRAGEGAQRGAGLLAFLAEGSQKMAAFAQSAEGQQKIAAFFAAVDRGARAVAAAWREFTAQGAPFVTTLGLLYTVARPLLANLEEWAPTIGKIAAVVLPLVVTLKTLHSVIGMVGSVVGTVAGGLRMMGVAASSALGPMGMLVTAAGAAGLALGKIAADIESKGLRTTVQDLGVDLGVLDQRLHSSAQQGRLYSMVSRLMQSDTIQTMASVVQMNQALQRNMEVTRSAANASIGWEAALDEVTASAQANGRSLNIQSAAGRANVTALHNAASAAWEKRAADIAAGKSVADANREYQRAIDKLNGVGQKAGFAKSELNKIVGQYNISVVLKFSQIGSAAALSAPGMGGLVSAALSGASKIQGRAVGGDVSKGQPYWVGERGRPELMVPDTNGTIMTERQVAAATRRGGTPASTVAPGATVLDLRVGGTPSGLERVFLTWLMEAIRKAGGNPNALGV